LNIQLHKQSLINERLSNLTKNCLEEIKDEEVVTTRIISKNRKKT
jgi:hypothetical protein